MNQDEYNRYLAQQNAAMTNTNNVVMQRYMESLGYAAQQSFLGGNQQIASVQAKQAKPPNPNPVLLLLGDDE